MPPPPGERHLPQVDWNILLDVPPRPLRTMSSSNIPEQRPPPSRSTISIQTDSISQNHLRVPSPDLPHSPPPQPEHPRPQNPSPETSDSESNSVQTSNRSPSPELNLTEPPLHPLAYLSPSQPTTTPRTPGPPETGTPQSPTPGTPPLGLSAPPPQNEPPHPENNENAETTEPESPLSSSAPNPISIPEFINVINAVSGVTIHRTVATTSVQSATHTNLTISLNIAHDYEEANKFLSHGLLGVIQLLMALRRTTLIPPPSPISPTSHTPTEEEDSPPPVYTIVRITDDREPITITTDDGEERTFVLVRYVNGATVFEAGTSNQNRG
ncbi:hypothetical protein Moror_9819 [Moniliophthora roreri MCA 2997]|uniref:Uncharacterized protein n=1 Tax=Moniliophthora roreri (strain MCA 2997) TaxID=1381753 RepID=V2WI71_MONRO|nr:hypothetical protein Moror_9819 [Moniliophthora roreri MCA 2997]